MPTSLKVGVSIGGLSTSQGGASLQLAALSLDNDTISEGASLGDLVGNLLNRTVDSTLALFDTAGNRFALDGLAIERGATALDYEAADSHEITVRETLEGASNSPRDTVLTVNVSNVLEITLAALSLDDDTIAEDQPAGTLVGNIVGGTAGSIITLHAQSNAGMFTKDGSTIEVGATPLVFVTVPAPTITLRETHSDASNSPRDTVIPITVTNVAEVTLAGLTISNDEVAEDAAVSSVVGSIIGKSSGSVLTLQDDAGGLFAIDGLNIEVADVLNYTTATSHDITVRETHADGINSPRDTVLTIRVNDASAAVLFARMTTPPDTTRKGHINALIDALKTAGVWAKLDALYVNAAHDSQAARLNWVQAAYDETAINAPTFTVDRGFTGDGATSYLDTGFNPATAGGLYAQNSAHMGVWIGTDIANTAEVDCGAAGESRICGRITAGTSARFAANAPTNQNIVAVTTSVGWACWSRNNSANYDAVKNVGTPVNTAVASAALISLPIYALAASDTGPVASFFSTRRQQALHFGSALDDTERDAIYNALATYMTAVGA